MRVFIKSILIIVATLALSIFLNRVYSYATTTKTDEIEVSDELTEVYYKPQYTEEDFDKLYKEIEDTYKRLSESTESLSGDMNSLEESIDRSNIIYNPMDLTSLSGAKAEWIDSALLGTNFKGMGKNFIEAEALSGVNAFFLIGLVINESGWGTSDLARHKNNLTGFQAYNYDPYGSAKVFDSWGDCIIETALHIKDSYLREDGNYYNGKSIYDINKRYAVLDDGSVNNDWNKTINGAAYRILNKAKEGD